MCELGTDGSRLGSPVIAPDLARAIAEYEQAGGAEVRWVWASTARVYPALLRAGVRVGRCHDVALAAALLASRDAAVQDGAARPGATGNGTILNLTVLDRTGRDRTGGDSAAPDNAAPGRAALDNAAPGRAAPDHAAPGRAALDNAAPGRAAPDHAAPGRAALANAAPDSAAPDSAALDSAAWEGASWDGAVQAGAVRDGRSQDVLFEPAGRAQPDKAAQLDAVIAAHAGQLREIAADEHPARFGALVAAESAGSLVAAEMSYAGIPWRADVHDQLLSGLLGRRPPVRPPGTRPARLAELAAAISAAFGDRTVNPDSPAQLIKAFAADGVRVPSTRYSVLREVDHPAVPLLIQYKELSRLHAAHGWSWLDTWVSGGRFKPEYVVGGVVSGRWASRGGGALQIPRVLRRAVVADPGWVLVVADAAQLEPRVLAALAGDHAFAAAAAAGDLYEALASGFGGDRGKAKIALLSAMYGGAGGEAGQLLAVLRRRFPHASGYVERAARAGEEGRVVRSVLGRTCPPPSAAWRTVTEESGDPDGERDPGAGRASRARGRFTRNFVVQASAADWALVLLAGLRSRLSAISRSNGRSSGLTSPQGPAAARDWGPHLVFFQHDEVIVHCQEELAEPVLAAVAEAADAAGRMVFGETGVRFPMSAAVVKCYADAK